MLPTRLLRCRSLLFKGVTRSTDAGLYFVLFGMMAGFLSTFWSFGYADDVLARRAQAARVRARAARNFSFRA